MKIACITTARIPSNTANSIQAMKVCHALNQLKNNVILWAPKYQTARWEELSQKYGLTMPFEVCWIKFSRSLKQYDFCWKAIDAACVGGADVVYTWALQAAVIGLLRKKVVVMEFHDYPMGTMGPLLYRFFLQSPGKKILLTTTRTLAKGLESKYRIPIPDQILQIAPNGTDLERYEQLPLPSQARKQLNFQDKFTVIYTGHFYAGRGMDMLIGLADHMPKIQFLWIGGRNEDIAPWKQQLLEKGINNVIITGFIDNAKLPLYQSCADVLVMPYQRAIAGSSGGNIVKVINPMKMFDYLATGRPIVASDIPIFHEVLNEQNAIFCPPDNLDAWVKVIMDLKDNKKKRQRYSQNSKADAQRYTWKARAQQTLDLLEKIMINK